MVLRSSSGHAPVLPAHPLRLLPPCRALHVTMHGSAMVNDILLPYIAHFALFTCSERRSRADQLTNSHLGCTRLVDIIVHPAHKLQALPPRRYLNDACPVLKRCRQGSACQSLPLVEPAPQFSARRPQLKSNKLPPKGEPHTIRKKHTLSCKHRLKN